MKDILQNEIDLLVTSPGVYLMKNIKDKVIYVGKAKNLKKRVAQYFLRPQIGKVRRMVNEVDHFETIQTSSEKEALLLEINLIRRYYPRFNIMLKDGGSYPYIAIKKGMDSYIRILRNDNDKSYIYFGPYPNASAAYEVLDLLNKLFPLRKCSTLGSGYCLYYHLGQCLGPCVNKIPEATLMNIQTEIERFLDGKDMTKRKEIFQKMLECSAKQEYEKAAEYKKIIDAIDHVTARQNVQTKKSIERDVFAISQRDGYLALAVLLYRKGTLLGKELFIIEQFGEIEEQVENLIAQFYAQRKVPKEIIIPFKGIAEFLALALETKVFVASRGTRMELITIAMKNAQTGLDEHFMTARLDDDKYAMLEKLGNILKIDTPLYIELFDNSHLQGANPIGAMVAYKNGEKVPKMYRKYHIEQNEKRDDYASMREVVKRRYSRLMNENAEFPLLILVDGGLGQVHAAKEALNELGIVIPIRGLFKNEKHQTEGLIDEEGITYSLKDHAPIFFLLTRMQDEVHRFALTFHRQLRSKSLTTSLLDDIQGLGVKRKNLLHERYPDFHSLKKATITELSQLVPLEVAQKVYFKLHERDGNS